MWPERMTALSGGGVNNTNTSTYGVIGGGYQNQASGPDSTVPGGYENVASGNTSFAAGAYAQATDNHCFVWSDGTGPTVSTANNQFLVRASGGVVFETSSATTTAAIVNTGIGGEGGDFWHFGLSDENSNTLEQVNWTVPNGDSQSTAMSQFAAVINSDLNFSNKYGVVATFSGGNILLTSSQAWSGVIPFANGGINDITLENFTPNTGVQLAAGSGSWSMLSDRRAKANFQTVNPLDVLAQVVAMPVTTWNYKTQDKSIRHIGPVAQDFRAAFGLGENSTTISTVDEGGVALAAIQGLNQELAETQQTVAAKDSEIKDLKEQNDLLAQRLNALEQMVQNLEQKK